MKSRIGNGVKVKTYMSHKKLVHNFYTKIYAENVQIAMICLEGVSAEWRM